MICETVAPPVQPVSPTHRIACHIPLDELRALPPVGRVTPMAVGSPT
jgi:peptide/nickel transport system ATP-binding protein